MDTPLTEVKWVSFYGWNSCSHVLVRFITLTYTDNRCRLTGNFCTSWTGWAGGSWSSWRLFVYFKLFSGLNSLFFHVGQPSRSTAYLVYPISDVGRCRKFG